MSSGGLNLLCLLVVDWCVLYICLQLQLTSFLFISPAGITTTQEATLTVYLNRARPYSPILEGYRGNGGLRMMLLLLYSS